ncbi:unnamed protein product, partial [Discosporangium mesarthrocarpum]
MRAMRDWMVAFDEKREVVIKRSRDIQKWSKNAIYSLHRSNAPQADKHLRNCDKAVEELLPLILETPELRSGSFANCME